MKNLLLLVLTLALLPVLAQAQDAILPTGVVAAPTPAPVAVVPVAVAGPATALIAPSPVTPAANPNAIKVRAEANPATGRLTVKTDNAGPTRVELTDGSGRPVLTYTMLKGTTPAVLNVSQLPAGSYIVRCTAYEKSGMRQVQIGQ